MLLECRRKSKTTRGAFLNGHEIIDFECFMRIFTIFRSISGILCAVSVYRKDASIAGMSLLSAKNPGDSGKALRVTRAVNMVDGLPRAYKFL